MKEYIGIKHPWAAIVSGDNIEVFFEENGEIWCWVDCPENYPRWTLFKFESVAEAKRDLTQLLSEGWELIRGGEWACQQ